jgi:hypothetical protein
MPVPFSLLNARVILGINYALKLFWIRMSLPNSLWSRLHRTTGKYLLKLVLKLDDWFLRCNRVGDVDGVLVCDVGSPSKEARQEFLSATREAMAFIKLHDLRRHRRICRQFDIIVNALITTPGSYDSTRKCRIDYAKYFKSPDPAWNLRYYACVLVHEATHGVIFGQGISYDKLYRERIEKLCSKEEYRFIKRADPKWAETHFLPFDAAKWELYWDTAPGQNFRRSWQRIIEAQKET